MARIDADVILIDDRTPFERRVIHRLADLSEAAPPLATPEAAYRELQRLSNDLLARFCWVVPPGDRVKLLELFAEVAAVATRAAQDLDLSPLE